MIGKTKLIITNFTQALKEKFFLNKNSLINHINNIWNNINSWWFAKETQKKIHRIYIFFIQSYSLNYNYDFSVSVVNKPAEILSLGPRTR